MSISLLELKSKSPTELVELAKSLNLDNITRLRKQDQIFSILKALARKGEKIMGEGVVEILQDGFGFLRSSSSSFSFLFISFIIFHSNILRLLLQEALDR